MQESLQNNNKSTATVLNKDMQPTHLCVCHLFSIYQTYGKFIFCTTQGLHAIFHCFKEVIILDKSGEQVVEVKQKIIIRNNNLLFQFSDHNNNLHDCSKTMENYALGHYS